METYFQSFQDEQFSTTLLLSNVDEVMNDQLGMLEGIKVEGNVSWGDEFEKNDMNMNKEDFQQVMSDWQQHVGSLQSTDSEDLGFGLDSNLDVLSSYQNTSFFEEKESPILSKALKYPLPKSIVHIQPVPKSLASDVRKELLESLNSNDHLEGTQKLNLIKTEPNKIRKVTLVNGEKELFGKNIIGLHCLNEIKENPDENCQVTSTVINGKRYKIIIKPKSLKVKKMSEEKIRKTLIKKLLQRNLVTKLEPKEDEITSEMRNGNYDVPLVISDLLPSWDFANLDSDWSSQVEETDNVVEEPDTETKKVAPLRIKIPKLKKHKKKKSLAKSDEEIDVETVGGKGIEGSNLGNLLKNFEKEVAKLENEDEGNETKNNVTSENIKNILPKEMIEKIEALKRKKDRRIPLIQAMPTKKAGKSGTRMQDAVATMNRNKLLKIVSGGDTVQLDHDYCSTFLKVSNRQSEKPVLETNLSEKNPKKDSGMESGDVSDASEGPNTPESLQNSQPLRQMNNKILEQRRRGDHSSVAKAAIAFFRASNAVTISGNANHSDSVKTKTVAYGNKALTNDLKKSNFNSDNNLVPSVTEVKLENSEEVKAHTQKDENGSRQPQHIQNERPKKKLKLEEYLNRRNVREKINKAKSCAVGYNEKVNKDVITHSVETNDGVISKEKKTVNENTQEKSIESKDRNEKVSIKKESKDRKYWKNRSRRSSSVSSRERERNSRRRRSRSRSGSYWRSSSNSSSSRRRERNKNSRRSESRDRRRGKRFWSKSLSRSSSRESSSSSDHFGSKKYKTSSTRYRRRSRSRSVSRGRSRSRNRSYSKRRRPGNYHYYCNRNVNNRRLKSPFYAYSMREKQRQIEERRVIYVGRIEEGMTNAKLRERFSVFGPIIDISLHFREYGDNYGFVTYAYKADAYDAVEHGNDDLTLPHYDLCFGGRRGFCKEKYADLDGMPTSYSGFNETPVLRGSQDSFDLLLKEAQAKLKNRKKDSKATL